MFMLSSTIGLCIIANKADTIINPSVPKDLYKEYFSSCPFNDNVPSESKIGETDRKENPKNTKEINIMIKEMFSAITWNAKAPIARQAIQSCLYQPFLSAIAPSKIGPTIPAASKTA